MKHKRLIYTAIAILLSCADMQTVTAKTRHLVCGEIFYADGRRELLADSTRIEMPSAQKEVAVFSHVYTARQKRSRKIDPASIDSIRVWSPTTPERAHCLVFRKGYGWCWILDRGVIINVYGYSPKGYRVAGNGGMWLIDKRIILVERDGKFRKYTNGQKRVDNAFRRNMAETVKDDPLLYNAILSFSGRRDALLRMLCEYKPI